MKIILIIAALFAAFYAYGAIVMYYGFKNWYPMCGGKGAACDLRRPEDEQKAG